MKVPHYFFILYISVAVIILSFLTLRVFAANQIKTTETFITTSTAAVSSTATSSFSIYIGDSLTGITNPVKSAHIAVSGVYTGNGTLAVHLDSQADQTFTLPNVSTTPTPFEVLYDASSTIAAISSAGTYTYTLNVTPSGVTVYGLGAKAVETHEYVPASCADGQPTNEKIKTTETFITTSTAAVSSTATSSFSIYIGDSLTGITNPVKSAHIAVSGVYTGNGTLAVHLDSQADQTFTLPNVSTTPTPFEVLYDASSTIAAISSAGTYTYTLNVTPSGVTVYGLGAKAAITHRYKPPACGGTYAASGSVESSTFNTGLADGAAYNSLMWIGPSLPSDTKVRLQLATSDNAGGPWTYYGDTNSDGICDVNEYYESSASTSAEILCRATHNNKRYFRYKVTLCSKSSTGCVDRGDNTPQVDDVIINWSP